MPQKVEQYVNVQVYADEELTDQGISYNKEDHETE